MVSRRTSQPSEPPPIAGEAPHQAQAIRLHSALATIVSEGLFVIGLDEVAKRAQVNRSVARLAIDEWKRQGWLTQTDGAGAASYVVTERCPSAPNAAAIEALALLQVIHRPHYDIGWLTYGYGSALAFHGAAEVAQPNLYVFHSDQTVLPPKLPPDAAFKRTTKTPSQWGIWAGRTVYLLRRHPDALRPYQRTEVPYQSVTVPCTSMPRTLIDAWLRPDLVGGEDRMVDAWQVFLEQNQGRLPAVRREFSAILRDSLWPSARAAFVPWLARLNAAFAAKHPDWQAG
jgi:predicted transcriptional regulator of viral defense system